MHPRFRRDETLYRNLLWDGVKLSRSQLYEAKGGKSLPALCEEWTKKTKPRWKLQERPGAVIGQSVEEYILTPPENSGESRIQRAIGNESSHWTGGMGAVEPHWVNERRARERTARKEEAARAKEGEAVAKRQRFLTMSFDERAERKLAKFRMSRSMSAAGAGEMLNFGQSSTSTHDAVSTEEEKERKKPSRKRIPRRLPGGQLYTGPPTGRPTSGNTTLTTADGSGSGSTTASGSPTGGDSANSDSAGGVKILDFDPQVTLAAMRLMGTDPENVQRAYAEAGAGDWWGEEHPDTVYLPEGKEGMSATHSGVSVSGVSGASGVGGLQLPSIGSGAGADGAGGPGRKNTDLSAKSGGSKSTKSRTKSHASTGAESAAGKSKSKSKSHGGQADGGDGGEGQAAGQGEGGRVWNTDVFIHGYRTGILERDPKRPIVKIDTPDTSNSNLAVRNSLNRKSGDLVSKYRAAGGRVVIRPGGFPVLKSAAQSEKENLEEKAIAHLYTVQMRNQPPPEEAKTTEEADEDAKSGKSPSGLNATVKGLPAPPTSPHAGNDTGNSKGAGNSKDSTFLTQQDGAGDAQGKSLGINLRDDFDGAGNGKECAHYRNLIWKQKFEFLDGMVLAEQ